MVMVQNMPELLKNIEMWLAIKQIDKKFWEQVNKEKQISDKRKKHNG